MTARREINEAAVHDVEGAWFHDQLVEEDGVVSLAIRHMYQAGNVAAQVHLRVQPDGAVLMLVTCPGEEGKTEVDSRGVKGIGGLNQVYAKVLRRIELPGVPDQALCEVRVDAPVAVLVGVGQGAACDGAAKAAVVQFRRHCSETGFDVAQAFAAGELGESQTEELIQTREVADTVVALIASHTAVEIVSGEKVQQLRENDPSSMHRPLLF